MSNNLEDYNIVAIGESDIWRKLGGELSKLSNCSVLRIPISLSPYIVTDKYQLRAIFLLPDAITIYKGSCRLWTQRLRFGPNVNTPIICIVEDVASRNSDDELKQLMRSNIVNWILTCQEVSALLLLRVMHRCQANIQRCLAASAGQIVRHGIRRARLLRETRRGETVGATVPSEEQPTISENSDMLPRVLSGTPCPDASSIRPGGTTPRPLEIPATSGAVESTAYVSSRSNKRRITTELEQPGYHFKKVKVENDATQQSSTEDFVIMQPMVKSQVTPTTSQSPQTSTSFQEQSMAHARGRARHKRRKRHRGRTNSSRSCAQPQMKANSYKLKGQLLSPSSKAKRARLQHKAAELSEKLDRAMIYISQVQSLLDGETSQE